MLVDRLLNKRTQKFKETGYWKHIYKSELDKACFAHKTAYSDSQDLAKRAISNNNLKDRAYEIAINSKYYGYQRELTNMVYKLAQELHKPVIKNSKEESLV